MPRRARRPALTPPGLALTPPVGIPVEAAGAPVTGTEAVTATLRHLTEATLDGMHCRLIA